MFIKYFKWGDSSVDAALFKKSGLTNGVSIQGLDALSPGKKVRFENGANKSDVYTVKQVEMHETGGDDVEVTFEEEFGVEIPDDAAEKIVTVKDAITFIEEAS